MSHGNTTQRIKSIFAYGYQKTYLQLLLHMVLQICVRAKYAHQIGHIFHICPILDVHICVMYVHIYATYKAHTSEIPGQSGTDTQMHAHKG